MATTQDDSNEAPYYPPLPADGGLGRAYRASSHADPNYYRVIFGGDYPVELDPDLQELARRTFEPLVDKVRWCIDEGVFVPEKPVHVAHALAAGPGVNPFGDETLHRIAADWPSGDCRRSDSE